VWRIPGRWRASSTPLFVGAVMAIASCSFPLTGAADSPADGTRIEDCEPRGSLRFLCGAQRPEDVVRIPGTRWLIYSGFSNGAGLKLVDSVAQTMRALTYELSGANEKWDRHPCDAPPSSAIFNTQGLSIRDLGGSLSRLHVVNHGGRESIEVFSVDARTEEPRVSWSGCVLMPPGLAANQQRGDILGRDHSRLRADASG
jgi:hypothetical protein